jgi:SAM-dependent methyltransferase
VNDFGYSGVELELFSRAKNWKRYWAAGVIPYLRGAVMEVGAGIGSNTLLLRKFATERWLCIEPSAVLIPKLTQNVGSNQGIEIFAHSAEHFPEMNAFDVVLYIDVLEHIADDAGELARASERLCTGGHLILLAPANERVFGPFDRALGHFRRYSKASLLAIQPSGVKVEKLCYLDSVGLFLLALDRTFLHSGVPTAPQVLFWDRIAVPISVILDFLLKGRIGKSLLAVWRKE